MVSGNASTVVTLFLGLRDQGMKTAQFMGHREQLMDLFIHGECSVVTNVEDFGQSLLNRDRNTCSPQAEAQA